MLRSAFGKLALVFLSLTISFIVSAQNQALDLSGAGNEVNITYDLTTGPGFTVEQWIYLPSISAGTSLVNQSNSNFPGPMDAYVQADGSVNLLLGNGTASFTSISTAPGVITAATWHHVAIVYDPASSGTEGQIFIDGNSTPDVTVAEPAGFANFGPIRIGRRADAFEGDDLYVDELRIWNIARDGASISGDYNQELLGGEAGLDVYLRFENNLVDQGFSNGLQNGGVVAGSINYVAGAPINENNYTLDFDGVNEYVDLGTGIRDQINGLSNVTVEAWVYRTANKSFHTILGNYGADLQTLLRIDGDPAANISFWVNNGGGFGNATGSTTIPINTWTHVAGSWDGTTIRVFINGVEDGSTSYSGTLGGNGNNYHVGGDPAAPPGEFMQGQIDEVRVWNTTRAASQILAFKDVELNGPEPGLVAYYDFEEGPTSTLLLDKENDVPDYNGSLTNMEVNSDWIVAGHGVAPAGPLDTTNPTVTITTAEPDPTTANPIPITITFDEEVAGFELADIFVSNGTAGNLNTADNIVFTADITPSGSAQIFVDVFASVTTDLTGNFNDASPPFNITYDVDPPLSIATTLSADRSRLYVDFNEPIFGAADGSTPVDVGDFNVTESGGTATVTVNSLNVLSPTEIEILITINGTPDGAEIVDVSPFASSVYDAVGNIMSITQSGNKTNLVDNSTLSFDGDDDYVIVPTDPVFELQQYTMEAWVNFPNGATPANNELYTIVSKGSLSSDGGIDQSGYNLTYGNNGGTVGLLLGQQSSGGTEFFLHPVTLNSDTWYHLAGTYDGATMRLFIDGTEVASHTPGATDIDHAGDHLDLKIGAFEGTNFGDTQKGLMDEVRIWNFARTDVQITAEKDYILTGSEPGLVAYYDFEDASGVTSSEQVASRNGTLTNFDLNGAAGNWASGGPLVVSPPGGLVSNTNDSGIGSLRAAIDYANLNPGTTITFNITEPAPWAITLATALPDITAAGTIIDGTTQPGWTFADANGMVDLDGSGLGTNVSGLVINDVANCEIYGLIISGFTSISESVGAVEINGNNADNAVIGAPNMGNIFHNLVSSGVSFQDADFLTIQGNRFGTFDGSTRSEINKHCIYGSGTTDNLTIGGISGAGEGNLISGAGNGRFGLRLNVQGSLFIRGNLIGTNAAGNASIFNEGGGMYLSGANSGEIGGVSAGEENVISGNTTGYGIRLGGSVAIRNNIIGLDISGTNALSNGGAGIIIGGSDGIVVDGNIISSNGEEAITSTTGFGNVDIINNIIGFDQTLTNPRPNLAGIVIDNGPGTDNRFGFKDNPNIIANNTGDAIYLTNTSTGNIFTTNQIYNNGGGIFLEAGANGSVTAPTIDNVTASTVSGSGVDGTVVHLYLSDGAAQGQTFLDSATVSGGTWTIAGLSLLVTDLVVATATDYTAGVGTSVFTPESSIPVIAPGGVDTNLSLWIKADQGVTGTTQVSQWDDQSGGALNATQGTGANQPALTDNAINYNPAISFDGTDDFMLSPFNINPSSAPDLTTIIVFNSDQSATTPFRKVFGHDGGAFNRSIGLDSRAGTNFTFFAGANSVVDYFNLSAGEYYISTSEYTAANNFNGYINGLLENGPSSVLIADAQTNLTIGAISSAGSEPWDGDIAEMIMYSGALTAPERQRIETYLAIKYGISIDQTAATNYLASDGNPVWDGTANITYNNHIAGIGRDDASQLNQKQSRSSDNRLSMGLGTIAASNQANANTFTNDLAYLIWGDDGGDVAFAARNIVNVPSGIESRLSRVWSASEVNSDVGGVTLQFDLNGEGYPGSYNASNFVLLVDNDADFSSGAGTIAAASYVGGVVEFNSVNISDGQIFTLGINEPVFTTTWVTSDTQITIPTTGGGYNYNVAWTNLTNPGVNEGSLSSQTGDAVLTSLENGSTYQVEISGSFPRIYFNNGGDKDKIQTIEQWGDIAWQSMQGAFFGCTNLDMNASDAPDLSGVTNLSQMFRASGTFSGDVSGWDVSTITDMSFLFSGTSFNGNVSSWDVSNVLNMSYMFYLNPAFNGDVSGWITSSVTNMLRLFSHTNVFNQDISGWDVSSVTNMGTMFNQAFAFNQDISGWNVSLVSNMEQMFRDATAFNADIGGWNVTAVTNMTRMFQGATSFNQDLSLWDVSGITDMNNMFNNANSFDQNIGSWDVTGVTNMVSMLDNSGISVANYDAILSGWAAQSASLQIGVTLGAVGLGYSATGQVDRTTLTTAPSSWTISGDMLATPLAPSNVVAYANSATSIRIDWIDNATNETGYNVERDTDPGFGAPVLVLNGGPADTQTFVDSPGADARVYYRVQPTNGAEDATSYSATEFGSTVAFPGDALSFDGADDRVSIADDDGLSFGNGSTDSPFSVESWIYMDQINSRAIVSKRAGADEWHMVISSGGQLSITLADNSASAFLFGETSGFTFQTGEWYHVAFSYDGSGLASGIRLFINGVEEANNPSNSGTYIAMENTASPVEIGTINSGASFNFDGQIDELRIWDYEKIDQSDRFFSLQGNEPNLIAYYSMDEGAGASNVLDGSENTNDGILQNGPAFNPSTLTDGVVTNTNDTGPGSLRDAIDFANLNPGTNITFNIGAAAPWVINLGTALPQITAANTTIDGDTQPGWTFGDPNAMVQVNGSGIGGNANGINIDAANVEVYGLILTGFSGNTTNGNVYLASDAADYAVIGESNRGNIFHGSGGNAIYIVDGDSAIVRGNRIGTLDGTTASAMGDHGISTTGEIDYLIIGGDFFTGEGNLISSAPSFRYGLNLFGNGTGLNNVTIAGNKIGTNEAADGALPNTLGGINILGTVNGVEIGGPSPSDLNIISGNGDHGIIIQAGNTFDIDGNYIGLQSDGSSALGNAGSGIRINGAAVNINIGTNSQNFISENTEFGIVYDGNSSSNTALGNNIFSCNGNAGIGYGSGPLTPGATIDSIDLTTALVSTAAADGSTVLMYFADDGCGNDQAIAFAGAGVVTSGQANISGGFAPGAHYVALVEDVNGFSTFSPPFLTNFVLVDNTNDTGTGSFRAALDTANTYPGTSIYFNIPGGGPWVINVGSELQQITGNGTIIDATTQPTWDINTGETVVLDGSALVSGEDGLLINASNVEVYGLEITQFPGDGIRTFAVNSGGTIIGAVGKGNVLNNNGINGIDIGWTNSFVVGNRIGTNAAGTIAVPNGTGGVALANNTTVTDNLISGHSGANDRAIFSNAVGGHTIANNFIGTDITGSFDIANYNGIVIVTGGSSTIEGNLISGNTNAGIWSNTGFNSNDIINNTIGMDLSVSSPIPNGTGILYDGGSGNRIGYRNNPNIIAGNTGPAIETTDAGSNNNSWVTNEIYNNGSGIVLAAGANNSILAPTIDNITASDVSGSGVDGDMIHLYNDDGTGQGQFFVDSVLVSGGLWNISGLSLSGGESFVATATNGTDGSSVFSSAVQYIIPYPAAEGAGEALSFNGGNNVDIPTLDAGGLNEITVEAWINPANFPPGPGTEYATIVGQGTFGAPGTSSFGLYLRGSDGVPFTSLSARVDNGSAFEEIYYDGVNFNLGEWMHVAMTWSSGNSLLLFVNGVQVAASSPLGGTINTVGDNLMIGSSASGTEVNFEGEIDEVRIWDIARSEGGIRQDLAQKLSSVPSELLAYYRMDDSGDALNLQDVTGAHGGTINGGATYTPSGAHLGDFSTSEYSYSAGSGRDLDNFRVTNLGTDNLPLHIYRVSGTPANNVIAGFDNIADTAYYGVFSPGQTYDISDSIGGLTPDRRIVFRNDGTDATWESVSGAIGVDLQDNQIVAFGQSGSGQYATAIDQNPYPLPVDAGYAMSFDGNNHFIDLGSSASFSNHQSLTVEAWIKPDYTNVPDQGTVISNIAPLGTGGGYQMTTSSTGLNFFYRDNTVADRLVGSTPLPEGEWSHVAAVAENAGPNTNLYLYVNGVEVANVLGATGVPDYTNITNLFIGSNSDGLAGANGNDREFGGELDEVRVWNIALAENNIRDHMIGKLDADFDSLNHLVAYYRFDDNNAVTAINLTGDTDGTVTGATPLISGVPQGQGSIYSYAGTPGILNTAQFGEDINVHYQDASNGIHGYLVGGAPNQVQVDGYDDLSQGKYYGVFAPGQKVEIRMDYNNGGTFDPDRRIVYRTDASDTAAVGGWERLSGLINSDVSNDSIFAYNVPTGEVAVATLNPPSTYPALGDTDPGTALDFAGDPQFVSIAGPPLGANNSGSYTVEAWINAATFAGYNASFGAGIYRSTNGDVVGDHFLSVFPDGRIGFANNRTGGPDASGLNITTASISTGTWVHIAATWNGVENKIFIDGIEQTLTTDNTGGSWGVATEIGRNFTTSDYYFQGQIDEVRVWAEAIAEADIIAFANTTNIAGHPNYTDMVAYYKFDDGTGSTILQDVFSNNDGALTNMDENTDWVPSGALAGAPPQNALSLDGTGDFTNSGNIGAVNFDRTDPFTVEAWIQTTGTGDGTIAGQQDDSGGVATGYRLFLDNGILRMSFNNTPLSNQIVVNALNAPINDGLWHHVAMTHDGSGTAAGIQLYIDGEQQNRDLVRDNLVSSTVSAANFSIGSRDAFEHFFDGLIDQVRVWDIERSNDEIYNDAYVSVTADPNLILSFEFNQDTGAAVESENGNDGTLGGDAAYVASTAFDNDVFAPLFSGGFPFVDDITDNDFQINSAANETGLLAVAVYADGTPTPTADDVVNGTGAITFAAALSESAVTRIGGSLSPSTDYDVYFVLEDLNTNRQQIPTLIDVTTNATPISNFALEFDGTAQYVAVTDAPAFDIDTDWTIEAWIKTPSTGQQNIVSQIVANTGYSFFKIGGNLYLQYYSSGGFQNGANSLVVAAGIDDDQWHHVAVSQNGVNGKIYVDGALIHDVDVLLPIDETTEEVRIGYEDFVGAYTGSIDEVRFWDYQRSDSEIATYYDSELVGNESGLAAYYSFNDGTGSTAATDDSGGGNNGLLTSMDENTDWVAGPTLNPPVTVPDVTMTTIPVAGTTLDAGTTDNLIYKFYLTADGGDATQQGMIIAVGGDAVAGDFSLNGWKLYESVNVDVADPLTATQVGATNIGDAAPDSVGFALSNTIFDSDTNYFYLVVDIDPAATVGHTFNVVLWNGDPVESIGIQDPKNKIDGGFVDGDTFTITGDATAPSVSNLTPSLGTIIDGDAQLDITIQFDEAMDVGIDPTITFPDEDPSNTLTFSGGVWDDAFNFTVTYSVTDVDEAVANIDVRVADAQDVAGNAMNVYDGVDAFNIDTENPVVAVDTYGTSITSPQLTGTIDDATATLDIEVDGSNYAATNNGDGTWTLGAGIITSLADGTYDVLATATDVSGNSGTDATTDELVISQTVLTLAAEDVTSTSFTARWSEGLDVQTYQVDVSTVADFSTFVAGLESFEINATSLAVSNLDFSTQYYYRVRLVNTSDEVSANSNTTLVTTIVDPETLADSTALRDIYDAISPQGLNWETARLRDWDGVSLDAGRTRIEVVNISGTSAAGDMPNPFTGGAVGGLSNLLDMDASDNQITGLMDFSGTTIADLNVSGNNLQFDDLEPVVGIATLDYSNQASLQYNESTGGQIEVRYTNDYSLSINIGGSANEFTWFRNDTPIATGEDFIINEAFGVILAIDYDNMGTFRTEVTSPLVPGLTIDVDAQDVLAIADMQVSVVDANGDPLSSPLDGFMLETTPIATGFPVLETVENVTESTFTFPDVVLGDYIILIESDLSLYIPTYFGDVFEWSEADTLFFRSDDVIAMQMVEVPEPTQGPGNLDVLIEEDFGDEEGRIEARRRASKRKCGVRRKRTGGRTGQDDDEFVLIAYGETDENGEFKFGFLPEGTYRFFVEYPGIPLDESSFVQFVVDESGIGDTDFKLQAFATEDGVEVTIEAVLGVILEYFKNLEIYPNPSSEYLNIRYRHLKSSDVTAQLVDLSGRSMWSQDLRNGFDGEINIDVTGFEEGIYILRFYDREKPQENVVSFRVIVKD